MCVAAVSCFGTHRNCVLLPLLFCMCIALAVASGVKAPAVLSHCCCVHILLLHGKPYHTIPYTPW
jgi:hypothetical protein